MVVPIEKPLGNLNSFNLQLQTGVPTQTHLHFNTHKKPLCLAIRTERRNTLHTHYLRKVASNADASNSRQTLAV